MIPIDLSGKTALITGATRGIGFEIARVFLMAGADLIVTGSSPSSFTDMDRMLSEYPDRSVRKVNVDFSDLHELKRFIDHLSDWDSLDICINNAAINRVMPIEDMTLEDVTALHRIDLHAPMLILSKALGHMKQRGWGRAVNIGSLWSVLSRSGRTLYTTAKHGLHGLTVAAAVEYGPHNVLVNTLSPGFVQTDLTRQTMPPEERDAMASRIPLRRLASPAEVAYCVLFLCSEWNSYLTGQNILFDGGYACE